MTPEEAARLANSHLTAVRGEPCAVFAWSTRETRTHWRFFWNTSAAIEGSAPALKGVDEIAVDKRSGVVLLDPKQFKSGARGTRIDLRWRMRSNASTSMLGHDIQGSGSRAVIVLNDWLCDTSTWSEARAYLTDPGLTWAFVDLRGYGRSRDLGGELTLQEAARDVVALAAARRWPTFSVVGHSMSSLVALHLAQTSARIERTVMVTPPPPTGFGYDDATLEAVRAVGRGDDAMRERALRRMLGEHASEGWLRSKLRRWRERADPQAVAQWVALFGRDGVPDPSAPVATPLLAVTGELDAEVMRREATTRALAPLCADLTVTSFAECGHYPMQEAPPRFAAIVERFLAS